MHLYRSAPIGQQLPSRQAAFPNEASDLNVHVPVHVAEHVVVGHGPQLELGELVDPSVAVQVLLMERLDDLHLCVSQPGMQHAST